MKIKAPSPPPEQIGGGAPVMNGPDLVGRNLKKK
jgi:hypothetical protein